MMMACKCLQNVMCFKLVILLSCRLLDQPYCRKSRLRTPQLLIKAYVQLIYYIVCVSQCARMMVLFPTVNASVNSLNDTLELQSHLRHAMVHVICVACI